MRLEGGDAATVAAHQVDFVSRNTRCWHFCPEHMEHYSPCREDGISPAHEASLRKSYCIFMQTLGRKLRLPQVTIATAIVFCHRFFLRQSLARNDRYIIATVCLFLAGKVEETPERLHNVIIGSYEVRYAEDPDAALRIKQKEVYDEQRALLLMGERLVLVTLGFNLNVVHPYKPLIAAIKRLTLPQTHSLSQLAQIAWNFVNDGLQTLLCLQFKPCHIAAGSIYLAAKFLRIKLFCDWEELLLKEFDISLQQLEDVSNQILQSYDSLVETSANSPGLCKLMRVAVNHTKLSVKEACLCTLQEAATATPSVKYEEKNCLHSIQKGFSEVNVEEREAILSSEIHISRADFDNARSHTVHSDLTEEKEVPELVRNHQFEVEDYWEYERSHSDEGNRCDFSSMENVDARSTDKVWLGSKERNSRRIGRHISPVGSNGKERDDTLVGLDRHDPWVRISSRERGVHKFISRREPLMGLTSNKKDVKKFVTRRNFLLWLSNKKRSALDNERLHNKKRAALDNERLHNRLKLFRRKAEILGQHSGHRSRGMKESGIRRSRYDFMS